MLWDYDLVRLISGMDYDLVAQILEMGIQIKKGIER